MNNGVSQHIQEIVDQHYAGYMPSLNGVAAKGHLEFVRHLLAQGANIEARGYAGNTPLHQAAFWGHLELVRHLLAQAANMEAHDGNGYTPLHEAACRGHLQVVRELLAQGANVEVRNSFGYTPIEIAREQGHHDIVNVLEAHLAERQQWATLCGLWRYGLYGESVTENAPPARSYDSYVAWLPQEILEDSVPGTALIFSGKGGAPALIAAIDNDIEQALTQERQQRQSRHIARP